MRQFILHTLILIILALRLAVAGESKPASMSAEQAIVLAREYVKAKKIDASHCYIAKAEYVAAAGAANNAGLKTFWRITWLADVGYQAKGAWFHVLVYADGNADLIRGK